MPAEAETLLADLVAIPSPSREESEAVRCLVEWLGRKGFDARADEAGNAVGVKGDGPGEILLLGHIDTFPGFPPLRREGRLLYGRGTVDAKGPLCAFACAAAAADPPPGMRITVVGAVEEEAATSRGARAIAAQRLGRHPRFCIIGEPSRWHRVTLGYKGRLLLRVDLRLPFSHSAGRDRLPAERAVDTWLEVERFCRERNAREDRQGAFDRLDPALRTIHTTDDGAWGDCTLELGFRLPPGVEPAGIEEELRVLLAGAPGERVKLTFSGAERCHRGGKANPLVRAFLRAVRAAGGRPGFVVKTGTCDMNVVAPGWPHTPVVAYGPGDSALDHTPHEHIDLDEYARSIAVLERLLEELGKE